MRRVLVCAVYVSGIMAMQHTHQQVLQKQFHVQPHAIQDHLKEVKHLRSLELRGNLSQKLTHKMSGKEILDAVHQAGREAEQSLRDNERPRPLYIVEKDYVQDVLYHVVPQDDADSLLKAWNDTHASQK